jgi:hypothetical protein
MTTLRLVEPKEAFHCFDLTDKFIAYYNIQKCVKVTSAEGIEKNSWEPTWISFKTQHEVRQVLLKDVNPFHKPYP